MAPPRLIIGLFTVASLVGCATSAQRAASLETHLPDVGRIVPPAVANFDRRTAAAGIEPAPTVPGVTQAGSRSDDGAPQADIQPAALLDDPQSSGASSTRAPSAGAWSAGAPGRVPSDAESTTSLPADTLATDQTGSARLSPEPPSYALDLAGVLQVAEKQNPQVAFARERIQEALAQLDRAEVLWLPSLRAGVNYNKHEGAIQAVAGEVFNTSRGAFYSGLGANTVGAASPTVPGLFANFHLTDAIFQPKIAGHVAASRQQSAIAATNDLLLDAALAYLDLLRAHQDLSIALETLRHTQELANLTAHYARTGEGSEADSDRASAELSLRKNDVQRADEVVLVASARLAQLLSVDGAVRLQPREPAIVPIELVTYEAELPDLVAQGLSHRPEIAESQQLIGEAVQRLKREQFAPLIPSVLLGVSYGGFGGGLGSTITNFNNRLDADAVAYWELRNLGFGDGAAKCEAQSRIQQARWREVAALDKVAREIIEAHAQMRARRGQIATAQEGIEAAQRSYDRNLQRIKNAQGLPIEVLQAIQALAQARREYLRAVIDYNRAQFALHRALGWNSQT